MANTSSSGGRVEADAENGTARNTARYAAIRANESPEAHIAVLNIDADQTSVMVGRGIEPEADLILDLGSSRTASAFFKHNPPRPIEIENAIQFVEDQVTRAREITAQHPALFSTDALVCKIAAIAGKPGTQHITLGVDAVESLFNQLVARSLGRPSSQTEIPDDPPFAATLLILREFMHHLQFDSISVRQQAL